MHVYFFPWPGLCRPRVNTHTKMTCSMDTCLLSKQHQSLFHDPFPEMTMCFLYGMWCTIGVWHVCSLFQFVGMYVSSLLHAKGSVCLVCRLPEISVNLFLFSAYDLIKQSSSAVNSMWNRMSSTLSQASSSSYAAHAILYKTTLSITPCWSLS